MTRKSLSPTLAVALIALAAIALSNNHARSANHGDGQKVVVHVSKFTNDLHAAFMGFKLGDAMQSQGASVTVLLDLEGVRIADTRNPLDVRWGSNPATLASIVEKFVQGGGKVILCPHCAAAAGVDPASLRNGVKIGVPEEGTIPKLLLEADKILDY